jgi:hypothetical protein
MSATLTGLLAKWNLIEFDFATIGIELSDNLWRPWRWFILRVTGLLSLGSIYDPQTGALIQRGSLLNAYFADREDLDG